MGPISRRPAPPPGPYLVVGLGRAGRPAVDRLVALAGADCVTAWDSGHRDIVQDAAARLQQVGVEVRLGGDGLELLDRAPRPRCVVKSPGIPLDVPVLAEASRRGICVIDELELGWRVELRPVLAVTGTNGKSTVATLAMSLLNAAGATPALAGNFYPAPALTGLAAEDGNVIVCEVSSFQLEGCPAFLPEIAVLTNFSPEHLDRHGTMAAYEAAKRRMFLREHALPHVAVVNIDHHFGAQLAAEISDRGGRVLRYGEAADADYRLIDCRSTIATGWLRAQTPSGQVELETRLPGRHNAHNALAALALADVLSVTPADAAAAIGATAPVPGRFQLIESEQPFDVIVDYAHNPGGLKRALETGRALVRERGSGSQLRVVCAAPRIRNAEQRELMGATATRLADHLILTTERFPATDAAVTLPEEFERAARAHPNGRCEVVLDRSRAIRHAIRAAQPGDIVMILGRGNLSGILLDGTGRPSPFDDRDTARRALADVGAQVQRA